MTQQTKSMTIYLSGPMLDHTGDFKHSDAQSWREEIGNAAPTGVLFISPAHAFFGAGPATARALDNVERHMISCSDGVLCNLTGTGRAFGTIRDIEFARSLGRPVAVAGEISTLMAHDLFIDPTLDGALDLLMMAIREQQDQPDRMARLFGLTPSDGDEAA